MSRAMHPKDMGMTYVASERRWVALTITGNFVPANPIVENDAHGRPQQFWDIGTTSNWWRVRRDVNTGVTQATRVTFP